MCVRDSSCVCSGNYKSVDSWGDHTQDQSCIPIILRQPLYSTSIIISVIGLIYSCLYFRPLLGNIRIKPETRVSPATTRISVSLRSPGNITRQISFTTPNSPPTINRGSSRKTLLSSPTSNKYVRMIDESSEISSNTPLSGSVVPVRKSSSAKQTPRRRSSVLARKNNRGSNSLTFYMIGATLFQFTNAIRSVLLLFGLSVAETYFLVPLAMSFGCPII